LFNRVGNSLGGGLPGTARIVSQLGVVVGFGLSILTGIVLYFARTPLARMFSGDDDVIAYVPPYPLAVIGKR
jgi:Na+-driven multidrug efflux pump